MPGFRAGGKPAVTLNGYGHAGFPRKSEDIVGPVPARCPHRRLFPRAANSLYPASSVILVRIGTTMACRAETGMVPMEARAGKEAVKSVAKYFAHTATLPDGKPDPDQDHWQLLSTHLSNVAQRAKQFAAPLGLSAEAELAGLLHDLGKYQSDFQTYLIHGTPRTPHAAIGAGTVTARSPRIANVIASHHAGLHDWPELEPKLIEMWNQRKQELGEYLALMDK